MTLHVGTFLVARLLLASDLRSLLLLLALASFSCASAVYDLLHSSPAVLFIFFSVHFLRTLLSLLSSGLLIIAPSAASSDSPRR